MKFSGHAALVPTHCCYLYVRPPRTVLRGATTPRAKRLARRRRIIGGCRNLDKIELSRNISKIPERIMQLNRTQRSVSYVLDSERYSHEKLSTIRRFDRDTTPRTLGCPHPRPTGALCRIRPLVGRGIGETGGSVGGLRGALLPKASATVVWRISSKPLDFRRDFRHRGHLVAPTAVPPTGTRVKIRAMGLIITHAVILRRRWFVQTAANRLGRLLRGNAKNAAANSQRKLLDLQGRLDFGDSSLHVDRRLGMMVDQLWMHLFQDVHRLVQLCV